MVGKEQGVLIDVYPKTISDITNGFSEENYIGNFQFGKVYRGSYGRYHHDRNHQVTVKVWEDDNPSRPFKVLPGDNESRLQDELYLYEIFRKYPGVSHPNLPRLNMFCSSSGHLAAVYDLKPLDTVHNLLQKDSFTWTQRVKVALGFASVLEFMHTWKPRFCLPYLIRNIDAAHIMLDQDYNPILFDFGMISGGFLFDKRNLMNQYLDGCCGYADPVCASKGEWSEKCDVFSYGVLLLGLISKRVPLKEDDISDTCLLYKWSKNEYKNQKSSTGIGKSKASLVHQFLEAGQQFYPIDGIKLTKLAMQCVNYDPRKRPTMKQVVRNLRNLLVVQRHADILGIDRALHDDSAKAKKKEYHTGYMKRMLKKSEFQILHWCLKHKESFPQQCKQLLEWCWQYFSESIHCGHQLFKDLRSSDSGLAGEGCSGQESNLLKVFSFEDLSSFTNGFSQKNFIDNFQYGKVFHGRIESRQVTVKIWEFPERYRARDWQNGRRLRAENFLLQHPKLFSHPHLVKMIGYCHEGEQLGVVYDLEPLGTVYNLVWQERFTWLRRIKVAFGFACLLKFLHAGEAQLEPYIVNNISASHVMLDQNFNPILFDFGSFSGGILADEVGERHGYGHGCHGYIDYCDRGIRFSQEESDVYAYGIVLLSLISKRVYREELKDEMLADVFEWAKSEYETKCSLVHQSFQRDEGFYSSDGLEITKLAMECVAIDVMNRPTMKQVVKRLLNLFAIRRHADDLGIKPMLRC